MVRVPRRQPADQAGIIVEWQNVKGEWLPRKTTSERLVRVASIPDKTWVDVELFVMVPEGVDRPLNMVAKMVVWDARQGVFRFDDFEISRASLKDVIAAGGSVASDLTRGKR
ncbi:MAG TPA: hypothetical protein VF184_02890 [Phycisphaeraceae bacterium]